MKTFRLGTLAILASVVSGCATNVIEEFVEERNYDGLYLRGVFSWWEADEKYKLVEVQQGTYSTSIELIADGQPYDFKFADADWTPGLNCGYSSQSDQRIEVGETVNADCDSTDENFRFTPTETGTFKFVIDFNGFGSPKVSIFKLTD